MEAGFARGWDHPIFVVFTSISSALCYQKQELLIDFYRARRNFSVSERFVNLVRLIHSIKYDKDCQP